VQALAPDGIERALQQKGGAGHDGQDDQGGHAQYPAIDLQHENRPVSLKMSITPLMPARATIAPEFPENTPHEREISGSRRGATELVVIPGFRDAGLVRQPAYPIIR
jgi:hypothetical protein